jgi:hypothetical protein
MNEEEEEERKDKTESSTDCGSGERATNYNSRIPMVHDLNL